MEDKLYRLTHKWQYEKAKKDADRVIIEALERFGETSAIGISGGKDSIAMLGMVIKHTKPLVIYNDSGLELPDSLPVVKKACDLYGLDLHIAKPVESALEQLKRMGVESFCYKEKGTRLDEEVIFAPIKKLLDKLGVSVEFVGLRAAESKGRLITIKKFGGMHQSKKYGCGIAWPMRYWTAQDVLAFIDELGLPLHPAYTRTSKAINRADIRVSWSLWSQNSLKAEEITYIRQFYPKFFSEIRPFLGNRV